MRAPAGGKQREWPGWVAGLTGTGALIVAVLLGTLGWFAASFGIGTTCTGDYSCTDSCAPCAKAAMWVTAGGIGQWVLAAAALTAIVLGLRRPGWRPALTIAACALIPLAVGWFAIATAMADHSY